MQCHNCGGEMKAGERFCTYCGAENRKEADKRHKSRLEAAAAKLAALTHLPQKVTVIAVKAAFWIITAALAGGALLTAGAVLISLISSGSEVKRYEKQIKAMQTYYENEQYAELAEYYDNAKDVWKDGYEPYYAVSCMADDYAEFMEEYAVWKEVRDSGKEDAKEQAGYRQQMCLLLGAYLSESIAEAEEAGVKEAAAYYRVKAEEILIGEFYMTEEELEQLPKLADDYDALLQLADSVKERQ